MAKRAARCVHCPGPTQETVKKRAVGEMWSRGHNTPARPRHTELENGVKRGTCRKKKQKRKSDGWEGSDLPAIVEREKAQAVACRESAGLDAETQLSFAF